MLGQAQRLLWRPPTGGSMSGHPRDRPCAHLAHVQTRGWVSSGQCWGRGPGRTEVSPELGQSTQSGRHAIAVQFAAGLWPGALLGEGRPPPSQARPQRRLDLGVRGPARPALSTSAPPLWPRGAHGPDHRGPHCPHPVSALSPRTGLCPAPSCPLRPRRGPGRSGEASGLGPWP